MIETAMSLKKEKESYKKSMNSLSPEQTGLFDRKNSTESLSKLHGSITNLEAPMKALKASKSILSSQRFIFYQNPADELEDNDDEILDKISEVREIKSITQTQDSQPCDPFLHTDIDDAYLNETNDIPVNSREYDF